MKALVLDGGSTDRTRHVASGQGVPVVEQQSRGKGGAIREGLELLKELGVRNAVILDADATYPGSAVLPALELLAAGNDLVVGVRRPESGPPRSFRELIHRVGNALLNFAAGQLSRSSYLDVCSGFWAVNVGKACDLALATDHFGVEAELFLKAHRKGWTVGQIPIVYRQRVGSAKLHALADGIRILLTIVRFGRRSIQAAPPPLAKAPSILRDLLLTSLINGNRDIVLVCPPALESEAHAIAARLRRTDLSPRIIVQGGSLKAERRAARRRTTWRIPVEVLEPDRLSELVGPSPGFAAPGAFRVRLAHHRLYLELGDPNRPDTGSVRTRAGVDAARSGGFLARRGRGGPEFLEPFRLLGSHLNSDPLATQQTFLAANRLRLEGPSAIDEGAGGAGISGEAGTPSDATGPPDLEREARRDPRRAD